MTVNRIDMIEIMLCQRFNTGKLGYILRQKPCFQHCFKNLHWLPAFEKQVNKYFCNPLRAAVFIINQLKAVTYQLPGPVVQGQTSLAGLEEKSH